MTILPIVERELRVASRHRATYWFRFGAALMALLIGGWIMLTMQMAPRYMGQGMFVSLSVFAFVYCGLAGVRTTVDSLSAEKRGGTMGLLFLTDLKGHDIVFGKLAATSLNAVYGMLGVFPVMAIPILLGGVSMGEFGRVVLSCLVTMFFSLSVGMFMSAVNVSERRSMVGASLVMLVSAGVLPAVGGIWAATHDAHPNPLFFVFSVGYAGFASFDETRRMLIGEKFYYYYETLAVIHGLSWLLLLASCRIVPRSWQGSGVVASSARRGGSVWTQWRFGGENQRVERRRWMLDLNPVYWLTGRDRLKAVMVWLFLGSSGLIFVLGYLRFPQDWLEEETFVFTGYSLHVVLKLWMALEAPRQFVADRESGALELVLSTPLSVREIVGGAMRGLRAQFLGPVLVVLGVDLLFLMAKFEDVQWRFIVLAGMITLVADMVALAWQGMWLGLSTGRANRSTATAVMVILVLPWILFSMLSTLVGLYGYRHLRTLFGDQWRDETVFLAAWTVIGLMVSAGVGMAARRRLWTRFRSVAERRQAVSGGFFARLWNRWTGSEEEARG